MQKIKADNKYREKINVEGLETTSADGTKVKHLFHSDSQVVNMRDERTLNEFANEVLDWEEKTAVDGKIEVGNCKKAWLKNFSISGNTKVFKRVKGGTGEWIAIANDEPRDTTQFDYKLESTQAVISNGGMKSVFYASEEDKASNKPIELPFAEDKVILNDDGSGTWVKGSNYHSPKPQVLIDFIESQISTDTLLFTINDTKIVADLSQSKVNCICNYFNSYSAASLWNNPSPNIKGCSCDANKFQLRILKSELKGYSESLSKSQIIDLFRVYISDTNIEFRYKLATPITTHIPKELMPVIITSSGQNVFTIDSPVGASSFKAVAPVDKTTPLEVRLAALETKLATTTSLLTDIVLKN